METRQIPMWVESSLHDHSVRPARRSIVRFAKKARWTRLDDDQSCFRIARDRLQSRRCKAPVIGLAIPCVGNADPFQDIIEQATCAVDIDKPVIRKLDDQKGAPVVVFAL